MPAYKYKKGNTQMWYAKINFQDTDGINRQHCKRGFSSKKDAEAYETEYKTALKLCPSTGAPSLTELLQGILKANNITAPNIAPEPVEEPKERSKTFREVFDEYWSATIDKGIKAGTQETKRNMFEQHVLPYFQDLELTAITTEVIKQWQMEMQQKERRGKKFSKTYLHSIQSQFNAVLNYAVRKKYLPFSPMVDLKNMGEKNAAPREIWTPDEYAQFAQYAKTRPDTFMLFELYYWVGLRRGEALGLRPMDIQYDARVGKTVITIATSVDAKKRVGDTKAASSYRTVQCMKNVLINYTKGEQVIDELAKRLNTEPKYQLQDPTPMMSAKSYKTKFVEPLIKKLREVVDVVFARYYQALDSYHRLNMTNRNLYRENEHLRKDNDRLVDENTKLKEQNKDYKLLRRVFGDKQIDNLLEQARAIKGKKRDERSR